jgi:pyruvate kinase
MDRTWNRTKIVCTIGPASRGAEVIEGMIAAGMDVARLNLSHGTRKEHRETLARLREASSKLGVPLAILMDLQGPRIRIGTFREGKVVLEKGRPFTITTREIEGTAAAVSTSYEPLPRDVHPGDVLLLADGTVELSVRSLDGESVITVVVTGGALSSHKGMNIPNVPLSVETLTDKDLEDLRFAAAEGADYVAVSFVRSAEDILAARRAIVAGGGGASVIAKIERPEAVQSLESLVEASDGIMVARGDLGVELPPEEVPMLQKDIIRSANRAGVPVITATQMLLSMVQSARPTRAEASDVANAVLDGTDALMLSEETAAGSHPVEAVAMMAKISERVESRMPAYRAVARCDGEQGAENAASDAVALLADRAGARLICAFTRSGKTALQVSRSRPAAPVLGMTPDETTCRKMSLLWGVEPVRVAEAADLEAMTAIVDETLRKKGRAAAGQRVVIVAGYPFHAGIHANTLLVHTVR